MEEFIRLNAKRICTRKEKPRGLSLFNIKDIVVIEECTDECFFMRKNTLVKGKLCTLDYDCADNFDELLNEPIIDKNFILVTQDNDRRLLLNISKIERACCFYKDTGIVMYEYEKGKENFLPYFTNLTIHEIERLLNKGQKEKE